MRIRPAMRPFLLLALCLALAPAGISAQSIQTQPSAYNPEAQLSPAEKEAAARMDALLSPSPAAIDIRDNFNPKDWTNIYEFAFWASSNTGTQAELQSGYERLNSLIDELKTKTAALGPYEKGQYVQHFMHDRLLKRYSYSQTLITTLLKDGSFNCVSSAVIYAVLGVAVGLDVQGVQTADHAFCTVSTERGPIDDETTNYYGFDPGTQTEFKSQFGSTTGFAYIQPGNYRDRQSIDLRHLVALIMHNRIADLSSHNNRSLSASIAVNRWCAQGGIKSGKDYSDLLDSLINLGAQMLEQNDQNSALLWSDRAIAAYGSDPRWTEFRKTAIHNLMAARINAFDIQGSGAILARYAADLSASEIDSYHLQIEIARIYRDDMNTGKWKLLWQDSLAAMAVYGNDSQLMQLRDAGRSNYYASLYNAAAEAYNRKNFAAAKNLAEAALAEFPADSRLTQLLGYINSALK